MNHFLGSATKFVLVMVCLVLSLSLLAVVAANLKDHDVIVAILALFSSICMLIVGFYFGQKGIPNSGSIDSQTTTTTSSSAVAGTISGE